MTFYELIRSVAKQLMEARSSAATGGSTLPDYRTQIATAQNTRSEYCTLVDGTAISPELADGVHPTTAGQATYADYIKTVLGLT